MAGLPCPPTYGGRRYVLAVQQRNGTCFHAEGLPKNGAGAGGCTVLERNTGLVYIR